MLTIIIGLFFLMLLYVTGSNGEWGPFALAAVILLALIVLASVGRRDSKAQINWMNYWADGGPDRKRRK